MKYKLITFFSISVFIGFIIIYAIFFAPNRKEFKLGPYETYNGTVLCEFYGNSSNITTVIYNTVEDGEYGKTIMHIDKDFLEVIKSKYKSGKVPEGKWVKLIQDFGTFPNEKLKTRVERF